MRLGRADEHSEEGKPLVELPPVGMVLRLADLYGIY